jgi:hypothetical protein
MNLLDERINPCRSIGQTRETGDDGETGDWGEWTCDPRSLPRHFPSPLLPSEAFRRMAIGRVRWVTANFVHPV